MMLRIVTILVSLGLIFTGCETKNPFAPPPASDYLNELVDVMEANHINKASIDWPTLRASVLQEGASANFIAEADDAILHALELLNDKSSFVLTARGNIIEYVDPCEETAPPEVTIPANIGYVKIPPFSNFGVTAAIFAEKMHGEIRDQDKEDLKAWIVDLRGNTGGNLWPMIAGIGPILGNGTAGFFVKSDGTKTPFGYSSGSSTYDDEGVVTVSFPYTLISTSAKVAVLVDNSTTNAGEGVMAAFSGKANARSFGRSTCGQGGGNQAFQLSDNSVLYLSVAFLADRNEKNLQGVIQPDELENDHTLIFDKAIEWINQ